jgi:hypothetical protein
MFFGTITLAHRFGIWAAAAVAAVAAAGAHKKALVSIEMYASPGMGLCFCIDVV